MTLHQLFGNMPFRSWSEFAEAKHFKAPKPNKALDRMSTNLEYFTMNYVVVMGVFMIYSLVVNPSLLPLIGISCVTIFFGIPRIDLPLKVGPITIRETKPLVLAVGGVTLLTASFIAGWTLLICFTLGLGAVLAHAAFRSRSLRTQATVLASDITGTTTASTILEEIVTSQREIERDNQMLHQRAKTQEAIDGYHQTRDRIKSKYEIS
eukprot:TRINITY_DN1793_c0_g1_i4.p1 TRINITY_DN1793_c0_g1~~TRINITY_DN1793_c0_g1_i4.p1  ORF type:complete len:208 (-),score=24.41 TRINITY_DN1793_c0_g1_i4:127-750(-)